MDKWVNIRWDAGDVTRLYVYAEDGKKVCEEEQFQHCDAAHGVAGRRMSLWAIAYT